MQIRDLIPWGRKEGDLERREGDSPLMTLHRDINRVFEDFWKRFEHPRFGTIAGFPGGPRVDVAETDNAVEVSVELPGLDEKDIDVSLAGDALTIKGEKKAEREESKKGFYLSERSYGSFYRTIPLPPGVDTEKADAAFRKGILTVTLPKTAEALSRVRKVAVKSG